MSCQGKYIINQFWFDFAVRRSVLGERWTNAHTHTHTHTHTRLLKQTSDVKHELYSLLSGTWQPAKYPSIVFTVLSSLSFFLSVGSFFYFVLTWLCLVCPCPSVLKPSRVLPLISPSVCDSTFCQQAQAAVQSTWLAAHRGGMDVFPKALCFFFGSRDPCRDGDQARLLKLSCSWCGENEKRERHTHTHTDAERCAGAAFFF